MRWTWLLRRRPPIPLFGWLAVVSVVMLVVVRGMIVRGVRLQREDGRFYKDADPESPAKFTVALDTTKGSIVIPVTREWAPHGADRFYRLVRAGYYDDNRFFRVVKGQWAQFGINGDPKVAAA